MLLENLSPEKIFTDHSPEKIDIRENEIHLWQTSCDTVCNKLNMSGWLDGIENQRSDRYRYTLDRSRFLFSHEVLRAILSLYSGIGPRDIQYTYGKYGKPQINGNDLCSTTIKFNMSHSGDLSLYAITLNHEIGVDVEHVNSNIPFMDIAKTYFSQNEISYLKTQGPDEAIKIFFKMWTRKEAYLKATGAGLTIDLKDIDALSCEMNGSTCHTFHGNADFFVTDLEPTKDFVGAVAVKGMAKKTKIINIFNNFNTNI